jgi:penicillin-binding protein 1C
MYIDRVSSTAPCTICAEFLVSQDGAMTYCATCLGDHRYKPVVYAQYPPELVHFWKTRGVNKTLAPPHNPECTRVFSGDGPTILSPSEGMTYFLTSPGQQIVLQAGSSVDVQDHRWYVDDKYLGKKRPGEKVFVALTRGAHTVSCMDDRGRLSSVTMTVKDAM